MYYYVFRKSVKDDAMKNCERYTDLDEAKAGAQDENYYLSHANCEEERTSWRVVLAKTEEKWPDVSKDSYEYEEIDFED